MVYNGDSDNQDLVSLCDDFVNTNSVTYPIKEKTRAANKALRKIWSWIFAAYGGWEFDDSNNTNFPIATTTLTANQQDYDIPTGSLTVRGVEILLQGGTVYQRLYPLNEEQLTENGISEASFFTTAGVPLYYRVIGQSIKLYAAPNYTITSGLRVTFDRGSIAFASTSTSQAPGFASEFHEAVAVGMAIEYARRNNLSGDFSFLQQDMNEYQRNIKDYYSSRYQEKFPSRLTVFDSTVEYQ
jgi:hypothetical protein